ncbi:MAG: hypothetical protein ABIK28_14440, partial [Planctomycetota bacterium]
QIVYSYSSAFPHWLLNAFFLVFSALAVTALVMGVRRYWDALKTEANRNGFKPSGQGLYPCFLSALKEIITHEKFSTCTSSKTRYASHLCVFFGFGALCLVTFWVITARINPFAGGDFIYPFGFWSPWKMLANAGGLAVLAGCLLMAFDRFFRSEKAGAGSYFDWLLIATLFIVVITGFVTEVLHYVRLDPHRHLAYFIHLVFVFALLIYLPYSKLAHVVYRTTALVFAEYIGRNKKARALSRTEDSHGR